MNGIHRIFAVGLLMFSACVSNASSMTPAQVRANDAFSALEYSYVVYVMQQFPVVATYLGAAAYDLQLLEVDGKLRDYSQRALTEEQGQLSRYRERFMVLDTEYLSARRRIDRSVALAQIEFLLHEQLVRHLQQRSVDTYLDEPVRGVELQLRNMASSGNGAYGTGLQWQAVLARVRAIPAYLNVAEQQLSAGIAANNTPDWRMLIEGLKTAQVDANFFSKTLGQLAPPEFKAVNNIESVADEADAAYAHFRAFLETTFFDSAALIDATALKPAYRQDQFALGETEYDWALNNNLRFGAKASDLFAASWPRVEKAQDAIVSAARGIANAQPGSSAIGNFAVVRKTFTRLIGDVAGSEPQLEADYNILSLVQYAHDKRLFDVPADYNLLVGSLGPMDTFNNEAVYNPAQVLNESGFGRLSISTAAASSLTLPRHSDLASMSAAVAREGFPGRDLQFKTMMSLGDAISPVRWLRTGAVGDSSSMEQSSTATEGWAAYAEDLMAESQVTEPYGVYSSEQHLYQLRDALIRELGVYLDTGIHTGRLTFDEAVDLYSETVDFISGSCVTTSVVKDTGKQKSCAEARSAIGRYARLPTRALAAELGEEQIRGLRERAEKEVGKDFSLQVFHLELMSQGPIPAAYFSEQLIHSMKYDE
jgi:uncharacterized protein (DUF885 family)